LEQTIFGFASLIHLCILLALCSLPFYLANLLGVLIDARLKNFRFRLLLPVLLLVTTAVWGAATYVVFKRDCGLVPKPKIDSVKSPRPDGFSFYNNSTFHPAAGYRWDTAIERDYFRYVDYAYPKPQAKRNPAGEFDYSRYDDFNHSRLCAKIIRSEKPKVIDAGYSCQAFKAIPKAETIVHILPERKSEYWWHPPIYELEIQVKDRQKGNVIASATDLIIGGGFVGTLLRAVGGDQDYEFLSCGYASPNIAPWRPSLSSRPRYKQYQVADTSFVVHSFSEN